MNLFILSIDINSNVLNDNFEEMLTFLDENNIRKILKVKKKRRKLNH